MGIYRCAACGAVNRVSDDASAPACTRCRRALDTSGAAQPVDAAALASAVLASPAPVLVDFTPPGAVCSCLDAVSGGCAGRVVCLRVDTGREPAAVAAFEVGVPPEVVLFRRGHAALRRGAPAPGDLERWLSDPGL
ncbi:MAG TPA: thiol reductase thioredoxin [Anaeromyxobacteraceae bacterium]|nr:thiol reductase thioredoxin [Anaeromyxobacteraceae bacterium]